MGSDVSPIDAFYFYFFLPSCRTAHPLPCNVECSSGLVHLKISAFPHSGDVMELRTVKTRVMKLDVRS